LSALVDPDLVKELELAKLLLVEGRLVAARASLDDARELAAATENVEELEEVIKVARAATKGTAAFAFRSFDEVERCARRDLEEVLLRGRLVRRRRR
jgi:hypothetical protein